MVSEVRHFAVLDVHPRFSHVFLRLATAALAGSDLRDGAYVRPTLAVVCARAVLGRIPREYLGSGGGGGVSTRKQIVLRHSKRCSPRDIDPYPDGTSLLDPHTNDAQLKTEMVRVKAKTDVNRRYSLAL